MNTKKENDYYKILEINKNASTDEIKDAYRRLARKYHPDKNRGKPYCDVKFKEVAEAYQVLSDDTQRKQYDATGGKFPMAGGFRFHFKNPNDLFAEMFPEEAAFLKLFSGDLFQNFFSFPDFQKKENNPYRGNYVAWPLS